jgi:hypothetical protein
VFHDARRAGIRDPYDAYAADGLVRMADAAVTNTTNNGEAAPAFTRSRVQIILICDAAAWTRGHTEPITTRCDAGIGGMVARDAVACPTRASGVGPRKRIRSVGPSMGARYASASEPRALRRADACERSGRSPGATTLNTRRQGWPTSVDDVALKCGHCHDLKTYKHWTDGPLLPNGKRTLIPPARHPPPDG